MAQPGMRGMRGDWVRNPASINLYTARQIANNVGAYGALPQPVRDALNPVLAAALGYAAPAVAPAAAQAGQDFLQAAALIGDRIAAQINQARLPGERMGVTKTAAIIIALLGTGAGSAIGLIQALKNSPQFGEKFTSAISRLLGVVTPEPAKDKDEPTSVKPAAVTKSEAEKMIDLILSAERDSLFREEMDILKRVSAADYNARSQMMEDAKNIKENLSKLTKPVEEAYGWIKKLNVTDIVNSLASGNFSETFDKIVNAYSGKRVPKSKTEPPTGKLVEQDTKERKVERVQKQLLRQEIEPGIYGIYNPDTQVTILELDEGHPNYDANVDRAQELLSISKETGDVPGFKYPDDVAQPAAPQSVEPVQAKVEQVVEQKAPDAASSGGFAELLRDYNEERDAVIASGTKNLKKEVYEAYEKIVSAAGGKPENIRKIEAKQPELLDELIVKLREVEKIRMNASVVCGVGGAAGVLIDDGPAPTKSELEGGKKKKKPATAWDKHVKAYMKEHGITNVFEARKLAKTTYHSSKSEGGMHPGLKKI